MRAVITVLGYDKKGIIYKVTEVLAENEVNILDLSQTILDGYFSMVMIVDVADCKVPFEKLQEMLEERGNSMDLKIRLQHQQIFDSMHNI